LTGIALSATPTINVVPIAKSRVNFMDPPGEFASEGLPERVDSFVKLVTCVKLTPSWFSTRHFLPKSSELLTYFLGNGDLRKQSANATISPLVRGTKAGLIVRSANPELASD
jgi:hypothetical protein